MNDPSVSLLKEQRDEFARQADDQGDWLKTIYDALGVNNLEDALTSIEWMQGDLGAARAIVTAYRADPKSLDNLTTAIEEFEDRMEEPEL
jgi:hypothetical protein